MSDAAAPLPVLRAQYQGALKSQPVVLTLTPEAVVVRNETSDDVRWIMPRAGADLREIDGNLMPNGRVDGGGTKGFRIHDDDVELAIQLLDANITYGRDPFSADWEPEQRWQYAVVNIGAINSSERMTAMLARAGSQGWELAATMDKASNWLAGMEKGFLLLKRPVPDGVTPRGWCVTVLA